MRLNRIYIYYVYYQFAFRYNIIRLKQKKGKNLKSVLHIVVRKNKKKYVRGKWILFFFFLYILHIEKINKYNSYK